MMTLIAQVTADMLGPIVPWIAGASLTLFLLNQALTFYKEHIREQPTPSNTYATKEEMRQAHGRMNREKEERDREIRDLKATDEALREKLDREIKDLRDDVIAVPREVVALLKETKGLLG